MGIFDFINHKKKGECSKAEPFSANHDDNKTDGQTGDNDKTKQDNNMTTRQDCKPQRPQSTPDRISYLKPDEVFVFGSNLQGYHGGGAARVAMKKFGAVWGQGVGLQGQSYAIPTMQGGVKTIKPYVDEFIEFARQHQELYFYVTRIGCGIAGFKDSDIAPLFARALNMNNVILPASFKNQ